MNGIICLFGMICCSGGMTRTILSSKLSKISAPQIQHFIILDTVTKLGLLTGLLILLANKDYLMSVSTYSKNYMATRPWKYRYDNKYLCCELMVKGLTHNCLFFVLCQYSFTVFRIIGQASLWCYLTAPSSCG